MMNEGPATESGPAEIALMWKTVPPRMPSPISAWAKAEAASRLRNPHPHPCGGRTLPENRQRSPVDALRQAWQDGAAMNESEKQFSFSSAGLSTCGRAKSKFLSLQSRRLPVPRRWHTASALPGDGPQAFDKPRNGRSEERRV